MLNVSEAAAAVIESDGRTFKARITVDGQEITGTIIRRILFTYGTCGADAFAFGSVFKSYAEIILSELAVPVTDKEMFIEVGPVLPDESIEYIPMGYFKATKANVKIEKDQVSIKGFDRLENNGTYIPKVSFPTTIQNVLDDISEQMGVTSVTSLDTSGIIEKEIASGTYPSVLGVLAGLLGAVVFCDRSGNIVIAAHPTNTVATVREERCINQIETSEEKYTVDALTVVVSNGGTDALGEEVEEQYFFDGDGEGISVENEYMTEYLFNVMKERIIGYSFDSCNLRFMGDPRIEQSDAIEVINWAGESFFVPCMSLVHEFDGGFTTEIRTPSKSQDDSDNKGPLQQTVEQLVHDLILAKKVIAQKITAERIDVTDLFAQKVTATNLTVSGNSVLEDITAKNLTITGDSSFSGEVICKEKLTIQGEDISGVMTIEKKTISSSVLYVDTSDGTVTSAVNANVKECFSISSENGLYIDSESYLKNITTLGIFSGPIYASEGTFKKLTTASLYAYVGAAAASTGKILVADSEGLFKYRTPAQILTDISAVQQGGGTDQLTNKIYIGWSGKMLKAQVDVTDMGAIITTGAANNAICPVTKGGTGQTSAFSFYSEDSGFFTIDSEAATNVTYSVKVFPYLKVVYLRLNGYATSALADGVTKQIATFANTDYVPGFYTGLSCYCQNKCDARISSSNGLQIHTHEAMTANRFFNIQGIWSYA